MKLLIERWHFGMSRILELTKMDTRKILINPDMIETVEANPDTVLVLYSGRKLIVKESLEEIYRAINES
jgi:flagellar protein FlbD